MAENEGGPAFPGTFSNTDGVGIGYHTGMSLRDWFAGQALTALINKALKDINTDANKLAEASYFMADAMLRERQK